MAKDSILDRLDARFRGEKPKGEDGTPTAPSQGTVIRRRDGVEPIRSPISPLDSHPDGDDDEGAFLVGQILAENRRSILKVRGDESSMPPEEVGNAVDCFAQSLDGSVLPFRAIICQADLPHSAYRGVLSTTSLNAILEKATGGFVRARQAGHLREASSAPLPQKVADVVAQLKPVAPLPSLDDLLEEDYRVDSSSRLNRPTLPPLPDLDKQVIDARSVVQRAENLERRSLHLLGSAKSLTERVAKKPGARMVEIRLWRNDEKLPEAVASAPSPSGTPPIVWEKVDATRSSEPVRITRPYAKISEVMGESAEGASRRIRSTRVEGVRHARREEPEERVARLGRSDIRKSSETPVPKVGFLQKMRALLRSRLVRFAGLATALLTLGTGAGIARGRVMSEVVEVQARKRFPVEVESGGESVGYLYGNRLDPESTASGRDKSIPISPGELKPGGSLYFAYQALMALEDQGHEGGLTDWIGVNPLGIALGFVRNGGGGSSLADQTCNAMQELLPYQFGIEGTYGDVFIRQHRLRTKINDTMCGMGLATTKTPEEIAALYFTYAYLASQANGAEVFARLYLQLPDGIKDSRLTIAHQVIMAAAVKRPYAPDGSNWIGRGGSIVSRANLAIGRLVDEGVITREVLVGEKYLTEPQFEGLSDEQERELLVQTLEEAVLNSKPLTNQQISATRNGFSLQPKDGYEYLVNMAVDEARDMFGRDFREKIAEIGLTSNGWVQGKLIRSMQRELVAVDHPEARGVAVLVDGGGRIIAAFSGGKGEKDIARSDGLDSVRFLSTNQMGSLGKLFLATAVAHRGYSIHSQSPHVQSFRRHLMRSEPEIIADARRLGVTSDEIGEMIRCFGDTEVGKGRDYLHDAAMGMYYITPADMLDVINVARTGRSTFTVPHVIEYVVPRDGRSVLRFPIYPSTDRSACASLIHTPAQSNRPGTGTWAWFSIPLSNGPTRDTMGTLYRLRGIADVGKTGTYGKRAEGIAGSDTEAPGITNAAWALVGTGGDNPLTGIFGIVSRHTYSDSYGDLSGSREMVNLESTLSGGNRPAEIARDTLIEAQSPSR